MNTLETLTKGPIYKSQNFALARAFTEHAIKIWMIVLGDDMRYWVVTPADATRLQRAGYEIAC